MKTRSFLLLVLIVMLVPVSAACRHGIRCYQEGAPPPHRVSPDGDLVEAKGLGSAPSCPRTRPANGVACMLPASPGLVTDGRVSVTVDTWPTCYYEKEGNPCGPYVCTCNRESPDAGATFVCDPNAIID